MHQKAAQTNLRGLRVFVQEKRPKFFAIYILLISHFDSKI